MPESLPVYKQEQKVNNETMPKLNRQIELLNKLHSVNFPAVQNNVLKSIISDNNLEFNGAKRKLDFHVIYSHLERIQNIEKITTDKEQKAFLQELKSELNRIGKQNPNWSKFVKIEESDGIKSQKIVAGFLKGLIAAGIALKGAIDFKNEQTGLAFIEAGIAAYLLRVDKWLDPMNFLAKEVKFLESKEWKNLKPRNIPSAQWADLCVGIMNSNGTLSPEQQKTWDTLSNAQKNRLKTLLSTVKSDSGKETVKRYLYGKIKPQNTRRYGTPTAAPVITNPSNGSNSKAESEAKMRSILESPNSTENTERDAANRVSSEVKPTSVVAIQSNRANGSQTKDGMISMRERFSADYVPPVKQGQLVSTNTIATPTTKPSETNKPRKDYNLNTNEYNVNPSKEIQLVYVSGRENDVLKLCNEMGLRIIENNGKYREIRCTSSNPIKDNTILRLAYSELFESIQPKKMHIHDIDKLTREQRGISIPEEVATISAIQRSNLHVIRTPNEKTNMPDKLYVSSTNMSFTDINKAPHRYFGIIEFTMYKLPNTDTIVYKYLAPSGTNDLSQEEETTNLDDIIKRSKALVNQSQRRA